MEVEMNAGSGGGAVRSQGSNNREGDGGCCSFFGTPFRGIVDDFNRRIPHYVSDWLDGWNLKLLAAVFFIFFTSIGPAVTFAVLLQKETKSIGVIEVLLSSALSGIIFSIFAGQPLVIVGVTGPVSILTIAVYTLTNANDIPFIPFYAWSQLWAALLHWIIAALNLCDYIVYVTNFSCETFGVLIALIYLYTGIYGIVLYYTEDAFTSALLQTFIAIGTAWLAQYLSDAGRWKIFNEGARTLIADYGATISIIVWVGVSKIGKAGDTDIDHVYMPKDFEPILDRGWLADMGNLSAGNIILAIVPGIIITVLFVFDHNVSSLMAQGEALNLKKGAAFHLDFFVLGFCIFVTGLLGIPPCNGLIPQAPLHTKALSVIKIKEVNGVEVKEVEMVYEQRYSNLFQAGLTLLMCFPPFSSIIALIPSSSLDGLFLFMGLASFAGNTFYERMCLMVTEPALRASVHPYFVNVNFDIISKFTLVQAACVIVIFVITLTPAAMVFPLLIAALVALRLFVFPKYMDDDDLQCLDELKEVNRGKDGAMLSPVRTTEEDLSEDAVDNREAAHTTASV